MERIGIIFTKIAVISMILMIPSAFALDEELFIPKFGDEELYVSDIIGDEELGIFFPSLMKQGDPIRGEEAYGSISDLGLNEYGECIAQNGTWVGDELSGYCVYGSLLEKALIESGISVTSATLIIGIIAVFSILVFISRSRKKKKEEEEEEWES